jgi:hypothetical protein
LGIDGKKGLVIMEKEKSLHRGTQTFSEDNLIQIFEGFKPVPSSSFYNRMQKAPWTNRYRVTRIALQAAILIAAIFTVVLINPSSVPTFSTTNTPTSTPTMGSTDFSFLAPLQTDVPPLENSSFLIPSGTPSN